MPTCPECGGTVIEYDAAAGNGFCISCGTVVEENTIVNEVAFGETSTGAAMVQGSYVGQGATHARMTGPYGNRVSNESREQTIANASRKIQSIANVLRLSEVVCLAATRLYTLAVEHKFTKGRKSLNVVAVCLYVACRQKETRNYMLIDFSDLLQVNVFELGHTYLQLVQTLNLRLPLVDPSHYISRFASLLEFGDETPKVATDAIRLVQRFDRDWMTRGRRPAGICGAALLLAARMNNFRRSIEEVVQVVKIADSTVRKRLDEFKRSPSGSLTVEDFRRVWLEEEMDPPAFTKGKEKEEREKERLAEIDTEEAEQAAAANKEGEGKGKTKGNGKKKRTEKSATGKEKKRKGKRKRGDDDIDDGWERDENQEAETVDGVNAPQRLAFHPTVLNQGILAGAISPLQQGQDASCAVENMALDPTVRRPLFAPQPLGGGDEDDLTYGLDLSMGLGPVKGRNTVASEPRAADLNIDPRLLGHDYALPSTAPTLMPIASVSPYVLGAAAAAGINLENLPNLSEHEVLAEETVSTLVAEEVSAFLKGSQGLKIAEALEEAEERRRRMKRLERKVAALGQGGAEGEGANGTSGTSEHENDSGAAAAAAWQDQSSVSAALDGVSADGFVLEQIGGDPMIIDAAQHQDQQAKAAAQTTTRTIAAGSSGVNGTAALDGANDDGDEDSVDDELKGLDEEELDRFLLSDEEVRIKERVWVELNRDYLEALAAKALQNESGMITTKSRKRRKGNNKPRDATTPHGTTVAESVRNLLKQNPKYSKRINYDALKDLFVEGGSGSTKSQFGRGTGGRGGLADEKGDDDDDDDMDLYTIDRDKEDDPDAPRGVLIIEETGSVTGVHNSGGARIGKSKSGARKIGDMGGEVDMDADGDSDEDEEKEADGPWAEDGDMFEQEV